MRKSKILIVEDESIIAMELESSLLSLGYEVTSIVDTGEKTLKRVEEDKPDIVLMDIRIKGEMDGIETASVVREKFGIPVVFSTAYLDEERIGRAKITMPFGYVLKPIQERDLKVTIEMALYVSRVDIERRKTETLLKESEEKYKTIIESANEGIIIIQDGSFKYGNPEILEFSGYSQKEFQTIPFSSVIHSDDLEITIDRQRRRLLGEKFEDNLEIRVLTKNQEVKWINLKSVLISWEGKPATLDFVSDISKLKEKERLLKNSEEKYRNILETMQEGYVEHDLEGNLVFFNDSFCRMMGYSRDKLQGISYKEIWSLEGGRKMFQFYNNVYKTGESSKYLDIELIKKDDETISLEISVSLLKNDKGEPTGFRSVVRDITNKK